MAFGRRQGRGGQGQLEHMNRNQWSYMEMAAPLVVGLVLWFCILSIL